MKLYHTTTGRRAVAILRGGFRDVRGRYRSDESGRYLTDTDQVGVWLASTPASIDQGAEGDALIEVDLDLADEDVAQFKYAKRRSGDVTSHQESLQEFLMLAAIVNQFGRTRILPLRRRVDGQAPVDAPDMQ